MLSLPVRKDRPEKRRGREMAARGLEDYVDVATRIAKFYEPSTGETVYGSIEAELVVDDGKRVVMKGVVNRYHLGPDGFLHSYVAGVGHAEEVRGAGMVNKTSALENCETSAWGRALAAAGLEVRAGIASKQEMEKVQRMQATAPAKLEVVKPKKITPAQVEKLKGRLEGIDPMKVELALAAQDVESIEDLTVDGVKELLKKVAT
jgi:hypothetical protein